MERRESLRRALASTVLLVLGAAAGALDSAGAFASDVAIQAREAIVRRDYASAAEWLRQGAEAGDVEMQYLLAGMYRTGRGVPRDAVAAFEWYRRAALGGHRESQYQIGIAHAEGRGTVASDVEARRWLTVAAVVPFMCQT